MNPFVKNIKGIMVISGLLTCTMLEAVIFPESAVHKLFGDSLQTPLGLMIVRSWGGLITLVGLMLLYAAFNPLHRKFTAVVAAVSKLLFVMLVILLGNPYLTHAVWVIGFDTAVAVVLLIYVVTAGAETKDVKEV